MNRLKIFIGVLAFYISPFLSPLSNAQVKDSLLAIEMLNASFEHVSNNSRVSAATLPKCWEACNFEGETIPDIQPGNYGVNLKPFHGNNYVGLVGRDNGTFESITQKLPAKLKAGICYTMSLYLAKSSTYESFSRTTSQATNFNRPLKLIIWGSANTSCKISDDKVLAVSPSVNSNIWHKFIFQFRPNMDVDRIHFSAYFVIDKFYNGNILIDHISQIVPVNCEDMSVSLLKSSIIARADTSELISNMRFVEKESKLIVNKLDKEGVKSLNAAYDALLGDLEKNAQKKLVIRVKKGNKLAKERITNLYAYAFKYTKIPASRLDFKPYSNKDDGIFWAFENDDICLSYFEVDTK
jgi:hypothetical protein